MAKKTINLKGTSGTNYNLDEIASDSRTNDAKTLVVQVYKYTKGQSPNPKNPKIGQIWLSKVVTENNEQSS